MIYGSNNVMLSVGSVLKLSQSTHYVDVSCYNTINSKYIVQCVDLQVSLDSLLSLVK